MSIKQTVLNPSIKRLIEDGFEIEIRRQHLLVHSIPYLNQSREIKLATLVCPFVDNGEIDTPPQDHTMYFKGEHPYDGMGKEMSQVVNSENKSILFDDFNADYYLSNKPNGQPFNNFYDKVVHYHTLFVSQARVINPNADGRTGVVHGQRDERSVFCYPDTASSRVGITAITQKLEESRIGIVGVGGTGSFILDLIAKTPVQEIHLFDADSFETHNAFRAPGAASLDQLQALPKKVEYFRKMYSVMREGIFSHDYFLDEHNIHELNECTFVFVAVDNGMARRIITDHLVKEGIPFIDVGMGVEIANGVEGDPQLRGTCRVTLATDALNSHLPSRLNLEDDDEDAIYRSNIQVADLNALNAALAVIRWKQFMGFYLDQFNAHNLNLVIPFQSLTRDDCPKE
ncbi:ThiF family adenylyltransferase [Acinetobacter oleivorans]|uniref:ThiF family adenylyltransferase n=1 Tax=Acinetobacter oleivorans TaxID=1148157 RepID=UPI001CD7DD84|nr:ThiF family adenylyltransferase [Acinetobacter oleivorans]HCV3302112.1 ThiF family adenylyltransferase [Acinetobacter baumannii]